MNIVKTQEGNAAALMLEGRLDTMTAPELEAELGSVLTDDLKELTFDFEKLEYISSAGLRVLLYAQKFMRDRGEMKIVNVNEMVMEVFEVTGFADILTIE